MSAHVEKISLRKWRAWCDACQDGENCPRQVDAHIWATSHNRKQHATGAYKGVHYDS